MKKIAKIAIIVLLMLKLAQASLAISIGNDVEYIPATRNLGVGVINPNAKLEINGQIMIRGGTPANGEILSTDANGLASWETATVLGSNVIGAVTNATNVNKISNGTIHNSSFFNGIINGASLVNASIDSSTHNHSKLVRPSSSTAVITVTSSDNVGINDKRPKEKLSVFGNVSATNFIGNGSMLTKVIIPNTDNATTANRANFATIAGTTMNLNGGSINNTTISKASLTDQFTGGTLNNTKLVNVGFDDPLDPWVLVYSEDFETTPTGWNRNNTTNCAGHNILGGFNTTGNGDALIKTFDLSAYPHSHVKLKFNYYSLDSWNNKAAIVKVDDFTIWSKAKINYADSGRKIFPNCGSGETEPGHSDTIIQGNAKIEHTTDSVTVNFHSTLTQPEYNESFGIDNLEIWVKRSGPTISVAAPQSVYTPPPPTTASNNASCSADGFYHMLDGVDVLGTDRANKPFGSGASYPNFNHCDKVYYRDGGHSLTRTWYFVSPPRSGRVVFKTVRDRRGESAGSGTWYWFASNINFTNHNRNVALHEGRIYGPNTFTCDYDKPSDSFSCTLDRT